MRKSHRRLLSGGTVLVLAAALTASAGPVSGAEIRTDTTLGGYSIKTNGAPLKVLIDDPASAIPHEPGSAILEADPAFTAATLETGPASRALASSLWPGTLLGDGIGAASGGQLPGYPIKADARYPDKPYTSTAKGCFQQDQPATCVDDGGAFMSAQALGLDVRALARANPGDVPGAVDLGAATSLSTATVKDGVAIGTSDSRLTDVALLGGVIKVGSVSTTLSVKGDGRKATSAGTTVVSGLTVGGVGYVVDEKGARPVGGPTDQGSGPLPTGVADPAKQLGISISGTAQEHSQSATSAERDAKGLRITVDTVVLRGILDSATPSPLRDALYDLFSKVPAIGGQNVQGYLFYLLSTTPKITFVLGAGTGTAAATLPLSFDFPPLTGGLPPVVGGAPVPGQPGTAPLPGTEPGAPTAPGPAVAGPAQPGLVKAASSDPFKGVSPALLLLAALAAGLAGWGLIRVQSAAFGAGATARCTDGPTPSLPDLRGE